MTLSSQETCSRSRAARPFFHSPLYNSSFIPLARHTLQTFSYRACNETFPDNPGNWRMLSPIFSLSFASTGTIACAFAHSRNFILFECRCVLSTTFSPTSLPTRQLFSTQHFYQHQSFPIALQQKSWRKIGDNCHCHPRFNRRRHLFSFCLCALSVLNFQLDFQERVFFKKDLVQSKSWARRMSSEYLYSKKMKPGSKFNRPDRLGFVSYCVL